MKRTFRSFALASSMMTALLALGIAMLSGCGDSSSASDSKASSATLVAAREAVSKQTNIKGKFLPADSSLSVRERRALKQVGELPEPKK
jgi:hypothetical protein